MNMVRLCSRTGDGYMQLLLPIGLYFLLPEKGLQLLLSVCLAFAIERPLYWVLKNTLKRRRPPEVVPCFTSVVIASDRFSFPSGHTMGAFLLATLVSLQLGFIALPLLIWACCVGVSRVILGVHFPSDVIAGAGVGSLIGLWVFNSMGIL
jgi:undecaprenyl-diphosphatase